MTDDTPYRIRSETVQNIHTGGERLPAVVVQYSKAKTLDKRAVRQLTISRIDAEAAASMLLPVRLPRYFVTATEHPVMLQLFPIPGRYVIDVVGDKSHPHYELKKEAIGLLFKPLAYFATLPDSAEADAIDAVVGRRLPSLHRLRRLLFKPLAYFATLPDSAEADAIGAVVGRRLPSLHRLRH